jgi:Transposase
VVGGVPLTLPPHPGHSIPKEREAGASVPELSRRHSVAENTICRWKSKFGGMEVGGQVP